ncbi:MAG TPA: Fe-only nitrogenase accessory AnfO family protein, partial [Lachnospiraceae bacterium]|nr:Fe-only nitrogenase accessory AnfO family protein [Lachnospiraceae bacterium]
STILVDYMKGHKEADDKNCNTSASDIQIITPSSPVLTDSYGKYYLDLDLTLKSHPALTSKKILLPFFEKTLFDSLIIDCSHVMPWLDTMLPSCLSYRYDTIEEGRKRIEIFANS